jgi:hypothetical protein
MNDLDAVRASDIWQIRNIDVVTYFVLSQCIELTGQLFFFFFFVECREVAVER